ncbi:MAG: pyridoxamine 5'-phosphate oxidase family protein [Deltaproteobacteria bacterium]|jgi:hypothetical protein|nr:pyridoxamine 5'-phosphate oxidase family protein [Deltaproteobacteria bacterium]
MRPLTAEEIDLVMKNSRWATVITVQSDGRPYAIEATPFYPGSGVGFMINPRGGTWRNFLHHPFVCLKYTLTTPDLQDWLGISCHGTGEFVHDPDAISEGWKLLENVLGYECREKEAVWKKKPAKTPYLKIRLISKTGRCSARPGGKLPQTLKQKIQGQTDFLSL